MATLHMVKSIFTTALDAALITLKSSFSDITNKNISLDNLESSVCAKFNQIIKDSGVRDNLFGKAKTVDLALSGNLESAIRNENWMKNVDTVGRLDEDVNQLRMLCSAKGLDRKTRVLNSCFSVTSLPGKSSSIIKCNPLFFQKIQRGEIYEGTELKVIDPELIEQFDESMNQVEQAYTRMKLNYDKILDDLIEAERKIKDLEDTNILFFEQCCEYRNKISRLEDELLLKAEREVELEENNVMFMNKYSELSGKVRRLEDRSSQTDINFELIVKEVEDMLIQVHSQIESLSVNVRLKCSLQSKLFDIATVCENMNPLCIINRFKYVMNELCDNVILINGLASRCGFEVTYE